MGMCKITLIKSRLLWWRSKIIKAATTKARQLLLVEERVEWLVEFLRDIGAALMVGAVLAGSSGDLGWIYQSFYYLLRYYYAILVLY